MTYRAYDLFEKILIEFHHGDLAADLQINPQNGFLLNTRGFGGKFQILGCVKPGNFQVINVDGKKAVTVLDDVSLEEGEEFERWYILNFPTMRAERTDFQCIKYPGNPTNSNDFRLTKLDNNILEMWRIAIIGQEEDFYFLPSLQYRGELQVDEIGQLHVLGHPKLGPDRWPQLQATLIGLAIEGEPTVLSSFNGHPEEVYIERHSEIIDSNEAVYRPRFGRVMFYDPVVSYGVIEFNNDELGKVYKAKVHVSQIVTERKPRLLYSGERVTIGGISTPVTDTGKFTSAFTMEALGVAPVTEVICTDEQIGTSYSVTRETLAQRIQVAEQKSHHPRIIDILVG